MRQTENTLAWVVGSHWQWNIAGQRFQADKNVEGNRDTPDDAYGMIGTTRLFLFLTCDGCEYSHTCPRELYRFN
eukprot:scaffold672207_cov70-Prasinocladus_malaysianus.AAC.1